MKDLRLMRDGYRQILGLSQVTLGLAREGDLEALEDVWPKRTRLMKRLEALGLKLGPCFKDWENILAGLNKRSADQARAMLGEIREAASVIQSMDLESVNLLQGQKSGQIQELKRLASGQKLLKAYHPVDPVLSAPDQLSRLG